MKRNARKKIAGIILAGGEGRRFGCPKALAMLGDENLTDICIRKLKSAGLCRIIVVIGASPDKVEHCVRGFADPADPFMKIVANPDWKNGVCTSVRKGLEAIGPGATGAVFLPVSYPLVNGRTVEMMLDLFEQEPGAAEKIFMPISERVAGIPVVVGSGVFEEFSDLPGDDPFLSLAKFDPSKTVCVAVEDSGAFFSIITREDIMKALQMIGEDFEGDGG
jgi:CTP:molybdopterin cytidylyltransferase MocA